MTARRAGRATVATAKAFVDESWMKSVALDALRIQKEQIRRFHALVLTAVATTVTTAEPLLGAIGGPDKQFVQEASLRMAGGSAAAGATAIPSERGRPGSRSGRAVGRFGKPIVGTRSSHSLRHLNVRRRAVRRVLILGQQRRDADADKHYHRSRDLPHASPPYPWVRSPLSAHSDSTNGKQRGERKRRTRRECAG
jgi:hypothetical protein